MKSKYTVDLTRTSIRSREVPNIREDVYCHSKRQALGSILAKHNCRYLYDDLEKELDQIVTEYEPKRRIETSNPESKKLPTSEQAKEIIDNIPESIRAPFERMYNTMNKRKGNEWIQGELDF